MGSAVGDVFTKDKENDVGMSCRFCVQMRNCHETLIESFVFEKKKQTLKEQKKLNQ